MFRKAIMENVVYVITLDKGMVQGIINGLVDDLEINTDKPVCYVDEEGYLVAKLVVGKKIKVKRLINNPPKTKDVLVDYKEINGLYTTIDGNERIFK